jgi:predicted DNA-binding transcriptional regulator YafY
VPIPPDSPAPAIDPTVLTTFASACRDHQRLRSDYRSHDDTSTTRSVEPHALASWGDSKWYLVAWDTECAKHKPDRSPARNRRRQLATARNSDRSCSR